MEAKTARVTEVVDKIKAKVGARGEGPSSPDRQEKAKELVRGIVGKVKEVRQGMRKGAEEFKGKREQARSERQASRGGKPEDRGAGAAGGRGDKGSYRASLLARRAERQAASKKEQG